MLRSDAKSQNKNKNNEKHFLGGKDEAELMTLKA